MLKVTLKQDLISKEDRTFQKQVETLTRLGSLTKVLSLNHPRSKNHRNMKHELT